jgi:hypothetical protein
MNESVAMICPYCGEPIEVEIDPSGGLHQKFIEDCWVCCQPIEFEVSIGPDGKAEVRGRQA